MVSCVLWWQEKALEKPVLCSSEPECHPLSSEWWKDTQCDVVHSVVKHQSCAWWVVWSDIKSKAYLCLWIGFHNDHKCHSMPTPSSSLTLPSARFLYYINDCSSNMRCVCMCTYVRHEHSTNDETMPSLFSAVIKHVLPWDQRAIVVTLSLQRVCSVQCMQCVPPMQCNSRQKVIVIIKKRWKVKKENVFVKRVIRLSTSG